MRIIHHVGDVKVSGTSDDKTNHSAVLDDLVDVSVTCKKTKKYLQKSLVKILEPLLTDWTVISEETLFS